MNCYIIYCVIYCPAKWSSEKAQIEKHAIELQESLQDEFSGKLSHSLVTVILLTRKHLPEHSFYFKQA